MISYLQKELYSADKGITSEYTGYPSVPAGTLIVVAVYSLTAKTIAVSDTAGNTFAQDLAQTSVSPFVYLFHATVTHEAASPTINMTWDATSIVVAYQVRLFIGGQTDWAADVKKSATGSSAAPASGNTALLAQAPELAVGALGVRGPAADMAGFADDATRHFTTITGVGTSGAGATSNVTGYLGFSENASGAASTWDYKPALGASRDWAELLVTYREAGALRGPLFFVNTAEGGTGGANVVSGNTGGQSGQPLLASNPTTTLVFDSGTSAHGVLSYEMPPGTGSSYNTFLGWQSPGWVALRPEYWWRVYLRLSAAPGAAVAVWASPDGGYGNTVVLSTSRHLELHDINGTLLATSTSVLPTGAWVRLEGHVYCSFYTGVLELKYFSPMDSATPAETVTRANVNTGPAATINLTTYGVIFGALNTTNTTATVWADDLAISSSGYIGPGWAGGPSLPPPATVSQAVPFASHW
jgi:hypothetical protein